MSRTRIAERFIVSAFEIPQFYRCKSCIHNENELCLQSPTNDSIVEYLSECDKHSHCGKNRRS